MDRVLVFAQRARLTTALFFLSANLAVLTLVVVCGLFDLMWLAVVAALAVLAIYVGLIWPLEAGVILLISGPLLLTSVRVGSLTGDNFAVLGGVLCLLLWAVQSTSIKVNALSAFPLLVAVAIMMSGLVNGVPYVQAGVRFISLALLAGVAVYLRTEVLSWILRVILILGIASIALQSVYRFVQPFYDADGSIRYGGLMGHPNFGSYVIASFILFTLASRSPRRVDVAISIAGLYAMLLAASQTASLVLVVVGLGLLMIRPKRLAFVSAIGVGIIALFGTTLISRVSPFLESRSFAASDSGTWRLSQWNSAVDLVTFPNWFGIGWQQTKVLIADGLGAHSGYVTSYVELGVIGSVCVALGLISIVIYVKSDLGASVVWLYLIVCSVTDPVIFYPSCVCVAIILSAIGMGGRSLREAPVKQAASAVIGQVPYGSDEVAKFSKVGTVQ